MKNSTLNTGVKAKKIILTVRKLVSVTAVVLKQPCQGDAVCFCVKANGLYMTF